MSNYSFGEMREIVLDLIEERIVRAGYERNNFPDETDLMMSGILDSFGFLETLASIEDRTGLDVNFSKLEGDSFFTLKGLIKEILK